MENERLHAGRSWHLATSAALSLVVVVGVAGWTMRETARQKDADLTAIADIAAAGQGADAAYDLAANLGIHAPYATSSTPEEIAQIGTSTLSRIVDSYMELARHHAYTPEVGARIAASVAPSVRADIPYAMYDDTSVATSSDTSRKGRVAYRAALQTSLAPFKKNATYELGLYDAYMKTHDAKFLAQIKAAAENYRDAASLTAKVTVPQDAVGIHVGILNATQEFATTLDFIVDNIGDPVTSLALLRSYDKAEDDMADSFGALDAYFAEKLP